MLLSKKPEERPEPKVIFLVAAKLWLYIIRYEPKLVEMIPVYLNSEKIALRDTKSGIGKFYLKRRYSYYQKRVEIYKNMLYTNNLEQFQNSLIDYTKFIVTFQPD